LPFSGSSFDFAQDGVCGKFWKVQNSELAVVFFRCFIVSVGRINFVAKIAYLFSLIINPNRGSPFLPAEPAFLVRKPKYRLPDNF